MRGRTACSAHLAVTLVCTAEPGSPHTALQRRFLPLLYFICSKLSFEFGLDWVFLSLEHGVSQNVCCSFKQLNRRRASCVSLYVMFTRRDFLSIPAPASWRINRVECILIKLLIVTLIFTAGREVLKFMYCRDPPSLCCFGCVFGLHKTPISLRR